MNIDFNPRNLNNEFFKSNSQMNILIEKEEKLKSLKSFGGLDSYLNIETEESSLQEKENN